MRLRVRRRVVYVTMGLTVLAMIGGFAAASLISTVTSGGQNGFNVTAPTGTMYGGGSESTNLTFVKAPACTSSGGTISPGSGVLVSNVYVTGEVACQTASADWFEKLSFTSTAVPSVSPSDTFEITVSTNAPIEVTVMYSGLTAGTSIVTTNIYYEIGASGTAVTSDIGITGS